MKNRGIEISQYQGGGYKPMVDYESWRVAVLRYCNELLPSEICKMQRHDKTDEVFVLLNGSCILFSAGNEDEIQEISAVNMEPFKLYNVKKGVWHTHTLGKDAEVLIIENQDTSLVNSPEKALGKRHQETIVNLSKELWK